MSRTIPIDAPMAEVPLREDALAAALDGLSEGVLLQSPQGRVTYANPAALRILGQPSLAALQSTPADALAALLDGPDDRPASEAEPGGQRIVRFVPRAGGEERWSLVRTLPLPGASGETKGVLRFLRDATDRRRADETLKRLVRELEAQRARLDAILRGVPGVVWEEWEGPDGQRFDFVSDHVEKMLGHTKEEWLAAPGFWTRIVHPDDRERVAREMAERLQRGEGGSLQFRWVGKDGRILWVQAWSGAVLDAEGRAVGMRGVAMDVSEQKRAEDHLARLAAIVQDSEDGIYGRGPEGLVTDWNPGAERLYGHARDEIVGQPAQALVPPDRADEEAEVLARVAQGERVPPFETERLRKSGARIHVSLTVSPIRDAEGRIVGASTIARDVSERKRAERAAARLAAIVLDSEDAIYAKTLDGRVTEWNPGAERLYGWTRDDMIGQPILRIVPPDRAEEEARLLARIAAAERIEPFETERLRKEGTRFPVSLTVSPIRDAKGAVVGASTVARDITERKRAERELATRAEELARLAQALERSNRELDQFAYVTSHDLKAPIRGIANLSRWIEEDLGEAATPEIQGHLELLRRRVHRMEALIDAILEYSRVGRKRGKVEAVDARGLLDEVVDLLAPPPGFVLRLPETLPLLRTERTRLQQVFLNLIGNAIKHHPDRERARVDVDVEDAGAFWRFAVTDDGRGIPRRFHERVFAPFQTLEARDKVEGAGIGLAIVKKVVESKGGRVELESDEGAGATFRFTWPKEEAGGE